MTIKRRAATPQNESKGRHPMLKPGLAWSIVYNWIHLHPGCSREDVINGTGMKSNEATGRVADLKSEGLVEEIGYKVGRYGKRVRTLKTCPGNMTGNKHDKLKVTIDIDCDEEGNYFMKAKLHGASGEWSKGTVTHCLRKTITLTVTPPRKLDKQPLQTFANSGLIIEGKYEKVE